MEKRSKLILSASVLFVLCVVCFLFNFVSQKKEEKREEESLSQAEADTVYLIAAEDIVRFSYTNNETEMAFSFDGQWKYDFDDNFVCSQTRVESLKNVFLNLTALKSIDIAEDLNSYGLDNPAYSIELTDGFQKKQHLYVGDMAENGDYYARVENDSRIYTISSTLVKYLSKDLIEFASYITVPTLTEDMVKELSLSDGTNRLNLKQESGEWNFTVSTQNRQQSGVITNKIAITDLLETLNGFGGGNCVDYFCDEEEKIQYGFVQPSIAIDIVYLDENGKDVPYQLYVGEKQTEDSFYFINSENSMVGSVSKNRRDAVLEAFSYTYTQ